MRFLLFLAACLLFSFAVRAQLPQLTGPDTVSPIFLRTLDVAVNTIGNKAITTFTMTFRNPSERTLEGSFVFPLPEGAFVGRYALDVNGKLREGVPVEKAKATQVFEAVEKRRIDPGLLEKTEGNNFRTRIYPVPARGERIVLVAFEQELAMDENGDFVYRLPLSSKGAIEKVDIGVNVLHNGRAPLFDQTPVKELLFSKSDEGYRAVAHRDNVQLQNELSFRISRSSGKPQVFVQERNGYHYFYVHTDVPGGMKEKQLPRQLAVIWDHSLSGLYRDTAKEIQLLKNYLQACRNVSVVLYSLNNTFKPEGTFAIRQGNCEVLLKHLRSLAYDGGTDYANVRVTGVDEVLLFSDGVATLSDAPFPALTCPVYTITGSSKANHSVLKSIAESNGGVSINLKRVSPALALERLTKQALFFLGVKKNKGTLTHYPSVPVPVSRDFTLAGTFDGGPATIRLQFGYGRKVSAEQTVDLAHAAQPVSENWDLGRMVAQKRLAELEENEEKNQAEILRLGRAHSLVTGFTSLLVLERVEDYVQHEVQPPAELLDEYNRLLQEKRSEITQRKEETMENALDYSDQLWTWWHTSFPQLTKPAERLTTSHVATDAGSARIEARAVTMRAPVIKMDEEVRVGAPPLQEETVRRSLTGSVAGVQLSEVVVVGYGVSKLTVGSTATPGNAAGQLLIVDGRVAGALPQKDQIEKVEVMTEKAGVALYGSRAMNGVLLITTKGARESHNTEGQESEPQIKVEERQASTDYLRLMKRTPRLQQYGMYLRLRERNLFNPTFYYEMANFFLKRDKALGLQILTNLGELDFQNHELFKLFGFKLMELGEAEPAEFIFRKVLQWRPQEPQSYRDYALALLENKKYQQALDTLYLALANEYASDVMDKYDGIEEILVTELANLVHAYPEKVRTRSIPQKLLRNLPADIRVVLNWNMNDMDIDLWVTDPRGEKCYYKNRETAIGGRLSEDFTDGYGPEQFLLKKALKGNYKVQVHYFGDNGVKLAGKATLFLEVYTNYGRENEKRKRLTLQLDKEEKEGIYVGEFTF